MLDFKLKRLPGGCEGARARIALGGGGAAIPVPRFQRRRINVRRGSRTEERGGIHPFFPPTTANGKTRDEMIVTFRKLGKNYRSPIIFCSIYVYQSIFQHDRSSHPFDDDCRESSKEKRRIHLEHIVADGRF